MISVQVDESQVKDLYLQEVRKAIRDIELDFVYWNSQELMRRTCMSWNNIQEKFFYDERFPKKKVGGKWLFPARATREFLEQWISEQ